MHYLLFLLGTLRFDACLSSVCHCPFPCPCSDDSGRTALHWAAAAGLEAAIAPLLHAASEAQAMRLASYEQDVEALKALGAELPPPPEPLPDLAEVQVRGWWVRGMVKAQANGPW